MPLLTVQGLCIDGCGQHGSQRRIVNDVGFSVDRGEVVALIGESGAGKTAVALSTLGFLREGTRHISGSIVFDGIDMLSAPRQVLQRLRGRRICYVAQSAQASLNPALTIGAQVWETMRVHGEAIEEARHRALHLLELLDLPDPPMILQRFPHQLSGGQQQRVMLAMAMMTEPDLLILDEPTTALDVTTQFEVLLAIKNMVSRHSCAVVYVSHDIAVVAQLADRIVVLRHGNVVEHRETEVILRAPTQDYTRRLISAAPTKPDRDQSGANSGLAPRSGASTSRPLLRVSNISAGYGAQAPVLKDVSLDVLPGEVVAVVGESGSGKSTLARVIAGLHPASSGSVYFDERPLEPDVRARSLEDLRRIQIVFQSPDLSLNPEHRVSDIIGRPLGLYFSFPREKREARTNELLDMVGLPGNFAARYPAELSGGEKQRVSLARALAAEPALIICDEVLASLDTLVAASMLRLLSELQTATGTSYVFISHDLSTVWRFANRALVLGGGEVCGFDTPACLLSKPHDIYIDQLFAAIPELRTTWLTEIVQERKRDSLRHSSYSTQSS